MSFSYKEKYINNCLNCGKPLTHTQISKGIKCCCKGCATSFRQKAHDPDIFLIENDDLLYYLLGLIFTDGNLDKYEKRITLTLTQKDIIEELYPYFCDTFKRKIYTYQPKFKNAKMVYTIINTNKKVISKLKEMSLTANNSLTKTFPNIDRENIYSFIRGIFDADGCIFNSGFYKNKAYKKISITCGSEPFAKKIYEILKELSFEPTLCTDKRKSKKNNTLYYICINKQKNITAFKEYIYNNANIYMKYKRQKFE